MAVDGDKPKSGGSIGTKGAPTRIQSTDHTRKLVSVWDPEGVKHDGVLRQNAADLVRHCGWAWGPKVPVTAEDGSETETNTDPDQGKSDGDAVKEAAMKELEDLRAKLTELGVKPDERWGKRTLNEKIAEAEAKAKTPHM